MWTLHPLHTLLSLLLITVTLVTFLSDRHMQVHNNNIELYMLTSLDITTFEISLKVTNTNLSTNLPATTMDPATNVDSFGSTIGFNNSFDSVATAQQDVLVSESEDDDYHSNYKYNKEDSELEDTVAEELTLLVRTYTSKHNLGKKLPSLNLNRNLASTALTMTTGYIPLPPPPDYNGTFLPTGSQNETPEQKFKTPRRKFKTSTTRSATTATISQSSQSNVAHWPPTKKIYQIWGVDIVCENKAVNTTNVAVTTYKKINRSTMSICNKNTLISLILSNQQVKFKNLAINTTELEKLDKTHSLNILISEWKTNFAWYNLLTAFTIITWIIFITGEIDTDNSTCEAKGYDLFNDYRGLTPNDVALSNQWYVQSTPASLLMQEDMN